MYFKKIYVHKLGPLLLRMTRTSISIENMPKSTLHHRCMASRHPSFLETHPKSRSQNRKSAKLTLLAKNPDYTNIDTGKIKSVSLKVLPRILLVMLFMPKIQGSEYVKLVKYGFQKCGRALMKYFR